MTRQPIRLIGLVEKSKLSILINMDYNQLFKWCVETLEFYAARWGMTYEELNIWIFVIIEPIIFFLMLIIILAQWRRTYKLKKRIKEV